MGNQYLRNVTVQIEGGKTFSYRGDENGGQGFRIRFQTRQKDTSTPNVLRLDLFNLAETSVHPVLIRGKAITLSAGYVGGAQYILFKGHIFQARADMRDDMMQPDSYLSITATDGEEPRNFAIVNKTLPTGHTHLDRAMEAADAMKAMGLRIGYIDTDALSKTKFSRPFTYFGAAKNLLRETCTATRTSWSIQNGAFQIVANDKAKPGGTIVLNGKTGLIGQANQTIQGVEGRCLLNGMIVPTCTLQIDNKSIRQAELDPSITGAPNNAQLERFGISTDGTYKVLWVSHEGDTRGEPFYTNFIAVATSAGSISIASATRGVPTPF